MSMIALNIFTGLPPEVLQVQILSQFSCQDFARLDVACQSSNRSQLRYIYNCCPPIKLPCKLESSSLVWKWFWSRGVRIEHISAQLGDGCDLEWISQYQVYVKSIELNGITPNCLTTLKALQNAGLLETVQSISVWMLGCDDPIWSFLEHMQILQRLLFSRIDEFNDNAIRQILCHANLQGHSLCLCHCNYRSDLFSSWSGCSSNLRTLTIISSPICNEDLILLSRNCTELELLCISQRSSNVSIEMGLIAVAHFCDHLHTLRVYGVQTNQVLLAVVQNCAKLRSIELEERFSNAALRAAASSCPHLAELSLYWDVTSLSDIQNASAWLSNITQLKVKGIPIGLVDTFLAAARFFGNLHILELSHLMHHGAKILQGLSQYCCRLTSLHIARVMMGPPDTYLSALVQLLQANRSTLTDFELFDNDHVWTSQQLQDVVNGLTAMKELLIHVPGHPFDDAYYDVLSRSCPLLRHNCRGSGPNMTDSSVMALATHCHHLKCVDVGNCPLITEQALTHLVQQCPKLTSLHVHSSLSKSAGERLRHLAEAVRGRHSIYCKLDVYHPA